MYFHDLCIHCCILKPLCLVKVFCKINILVINSIRVSVTLHSLSSPVFNPFMPNPRQHEWPLAVLPLWIFRLAQFYKFVWKSCDVLASNTCTLFWFRNGWSLLIHKMLLNSYKSLKVGCTLNGCSTPKDQFSLFCRMILSITVYFKHRCYTMHYVFNITQEPQDLQTFDCACWVHRQICYDKIPSIAVKSSMS